MYTKDSKITTAKANLANYIPGQDAYNSKLLVQLTDPGLSKEIYEITTYQGRPDLIAKDFYGSIDYMGLLILQGGIGLEGYKKGTYLNLLPRATLDYILKNL